MILKHIKIPFKAPSFLKPLFFWKEKTEIKKIHSKRGTALNPEKQAQLEALCQQLFKKKELITSGKFQFIGLAQIKKRMGKRWKGLSKIVYETAENVIDQHMDKGDIFIRYNDDTYIIIFSFASLEETTQKAALIAEEINKRLFALDEEELRSIKIRQAVSEISTETLMKAGMLGDMFGAMDNELGDLEFGFQGEEKEDEGELLDAVKTTEVGTEYKNTKNLLDKKDDTELPELSYNYVPLWDTKKGALTTYLCLSTALSSEKNPFDSHQDIYANRSLSGQLDLDKSILKIVAEELKNMENDGRQFFVVCPVQHSVVYNMESYEEYKKLLSEIPEEHRKFLFLLVMDMDDTQLLKDAYWFAKPLRVLCPHVFAEIPLRRDINFSYLHNSGVDVAGVRLNKKSMTEQEILNLLNNFSAKAKTLKIPQIFVLNVASLSITTTAVCAGFDFLGGRAIHDIVKKPDNVHRYHHADLIKGLTN